MDMKLKIHYSRMWLGSLRLTISKILFFDDTLWLHNLHELHNSKKSCLRGYYPQSEEWLTSYFPRPESGRRRGVDFHLYPFFFKNYFPHKSISTKSSGIKLKGIREENDGSACAFQIPCDFLIHFTSQRRNKAYDKYPSKTKYSHLF